MLKRYTLAIAAVVIGSMLVACDDASSPQLGDVQISYRVGSGSSTCEDVGIAFVRVYLVSETESAVDETFACDPEGQTVTLMDVEAGSYTVRVEGLDSSHAVIYSGESDEDALEVEADQTNGPVSVVLNQLSGHADLDGLRRPGRLLARRGRRHRHSSL